MTAASSLPPSRRSSTRGHETRPSDTVVKQHAAARKQRAGSTRYTNGTGELPRARNPLAQALLMDEREQIAAQ